MPTTAAKAAKTLHTTTTQGGFTLKTYRGCGSVMLAFNLEDHLTDHLAGFAIRRKSASGSWEPLMNRLNFTSGYTSKTKATDREWTPSDQAPFQKFWWVDFPPDSEHGLYTYEATVMRFDGQQMVPDQTASAVVELGPFKQGNFELAFTRGYLSSQAFAEKVKAGKFKSEIRPLPKNITYSTTPYLGEYEWLGFEARRTIFQFLEEAFNDGSSIDVFAYDLDEPDFIRELQKFGSRLRIVQDDASLHTGSTAMEPKATKLLRNSAGDDHVVLGKFGNFAHDKVIIKITNGRAEKVLTGSTNFSVTGLYVNANNVMVFDDKDVAGLYERVFSEAFSSKCNRSQFCANSLSQKEFEFTKSSLPHTFISFAPHKDSNASLKRVVREIDGANSSVLFAIMALQGGGDVLKTLKEIHRDGKVFSYGVTDNPDGADIYKPGNKTGILVPTPSLTKNIPPPFIKEFTSGNAHRVHHKFVVVDFNDSDPVLFAGSSNLAKGGEEKNGDNLLAIYDREVACAYAIEAIRLVDHYQFRAALQTATKANPLQLGAEKDEWWKDFYDPKSMKFKERLLFSR